jgi:hypothetical protein
MRRQSAPLFGLSQSNSLPFDFRGHEFDGKDLVPSGSQFAEYGVGGLVWLCFMRAASTGPRRLPMSLL